MLVIERAKTTTTTKSTFTKKQKLKPTVDVFFGSKIIRSETAYSSWCIIALPVSTAEPLRVFLFEV